MVSWCSYSCLHPMRWQISCYKDQSEDRGYSVALRNSRLICFALSFIYLLDLEARQFARHVQDAGRGSGSGLEHIQSEHLSQASVKPGLARNEEWRMSCVGDWAVRHRVRLACNGQENINSRDLRGGGGGELLDASHWSVSVQSEPLIGWRSQDTARPIN